ncbi:MerR family transcriptional regulator [Pseudorhodoferax sp. Leaf267]|uniref:MerR family transcriptional regulator n=1 Tax=Pseudorhodoferax sp. Leaf267 TaxID=1736316 RepID=UPI0006F910A9|nr:MerR family transcriptional regulator [Pseudorhodoferax sp. Leaf267]KQP23244.1 MerR family transcriptional regulator [Pseudorhodoferax sp. Leaf267]
MHDASRFLRPSEAAARLGVSAKALRLYEQRGLVTPARTPAGWRSYGPHEMARGAEVVALRTLGLSLAQVARALGGDPQDLKPALAAHEAALATRIRELTDTMAQVRRLQSDLGKGQAPTLKESTSLAAPAKAPGIAFDLPWPWGGERFTLPRIQPLTYVVGPLGSGKTRFAMRLAETVPGARFLGLERAHDGAARSRLENDAALGARVDRTRTWLLEHGAVASQALTALLAGLEDHSATVLIVDLVEQGLDHATQRALAAHLRRRERAGSPLFLLTRSCAILDLDAVQPHASIILCPANHSAPTPVAPCLGAPGYEAVATCLASPEVRSRTEGVIACRPTRPALHA